MSLTKLWSSSSSKSLWVIVVLLPSDKFESSVKSETTEITDGLGGLARPLPRR